MTATLEIRRQNTGDRVVRHTQECPEAIVGSLLNDPDGLLRGGTTVKAGDRTSIARIDHQARSFALKRYNLKGPLHTTMHLLLRSRAQWSWGNGWKLIEAGLPSPRPVAMVEERQGPLRLRSFLLTEWVEGHRLTDWIEARGPEAIGAMAEQFGRIWEHLGVLGLSHGDMKATNFLVDERAEPWLIDLDAMREHRVNPLLVRARRRDLKRFLKNWEQHPDIAEAFGTQMDSSHH